MTTLRKWLRADGPLEVPRWIWILFVLCVGAAMSLVGWAGALAASPFLLLHRLLRRGSPADRAELPDPHETIRGVEVSRQAEERVRRMEQQIDQAAEDRRRVERTDVTELVREHNEERRRRGR